MKEQNRLKQKSVMIMSNTEANPHIHSPIPWIAYISRQSETIDKSAQFKK